MSLRILLRDREIFPPYLIRKPGFSEEEYFEMTDEDSLCELFYGELIMHSPSSIKHERIFSFLITLLNIYVERNRLGTVIGSRFAMRLRRNLIVEPDVIFIGKKKEKNIKSTYLDGPCDLVVEILSKSTRGYDLNEKRRAYRDHRIPEIWLVDADNKVLIVDILSDAAYKTKNIQKGSFTSAVLKGFSLQASWLWEEPLPLVTDCIEKILG
ncbi:MAG TPA: Uma2 family endonuclease [Thermodesulfobacteriota bacterium]|nr:Uma2 family endonuclease [Thermodesulfobacteriota bacterium]